YRAKAAVEPLYAAKDNAINIKEKKYLDKCHSFGFNFVPMVVETTGGWCPQASNFFNILCHRAAHRTNGITKVTRCLLYQKLSTTLQKTNAILVLKKLPLMEI